MEGIGLFSKWDVLTSQAYAPHMPAIASKKCAAYARHFFPVESMKENMAGIFGLSKFPCLGYKKCPAYAHTLPGICPAYACENPMQGLYAYLYLFMYIRLDGGVYKTSGMQRKIGIYEAYARNKRGINEA